MLTIVATPIGNLKDITLRALEVLNSVDEVICEDSRRTGLLLNNYNIKKPLSVLNDYNEVRIIPQIISKLENGKNLALVSDAGTPLISDPGYKLVRECKRMGISVDSIPGPSSVITALTLSGLPPDKFLFLGYLPEKVGHRKELLNRLTAIQDSIAVTYIVFVAPHKLVTTLEDIKEVLGDIEVCLAKELTKMYQNTDTKKISLWLEEFTHKAPKGEFTLLFRLDK